jgi:hypothetical protein
MDDLGGIPAEQLQALNDAFRALLLPSLEECARGRWGLFGQNQSRDAENSLEWPEAEKVRELAVSIQALLAQSGERSALCDEFLDLCTMHGESNPGEPRLARAFLKRIENGEVGTPTQKDIPWKS